MDKSIFLVAVIIILLFMGICYNIAYDNRERNKDFLFKREVCESAGGTFLSDVYSKYIHRGISGDWCIGD